MDSARLGEERSSGRRKSSEKVGELKLLARSPIRWRAGRQAGQSIKDEKKIILIIIFFIILARTPEIGQGLGRILSCGARKPEQT